jgi:hypothetical protein
MSGFSIESPGAPNGGSAERHRDTCEKYEERRRPPADERGDVKRLAAPRGGDRPGIHRMPEDHDDDRRSPEPVEVETARHGAFSSEKWKAES